MTKNWLDPFLKASKIASQEELAEAIGVSRATVNRLANDHSLLKRDRAEVLAGVLGTTAEALILNRPPRHSSLVSSFDPDTDGAHDDEPSYGYTREHWQAQIKGAIPEIDVKLGAGEGAIGEVINLPVSASSVSGHEVVAEWFIPDAYLRNEAKASPNNTIVMEVVGDSMFPTYSPGDRVIVDLAQNRFVSDTVYAISDGASEPQIKRLQRVMFSDPVQVDIISDNQHLRTITVELDRLTIIGRICGHIARK
ncbi:repressor [Sinorhizobium glycinis]|uniref:Repressor n=1 Tax=Sinorhizobium glycinis TaxID=1472378 RepID=A0A178XZ48_9HYPH|nr:LexA family transcriptional regulator [Sinorhizobium glycinis]OAP40384.1 repressor [Sinorhizobium glycinis]